MVDATILLNALVTTSSLAVSSSVRTPRREAACSCRAQRHMHTNTAAGSVTAALHRLWVWCTLVVVTVNVLICQRANSSSCLLLAWYCNTTESNPIQQRCKPSFDTIIHQRPNPTLASVVPACCLVPVQALTGALTGIGEIIQGVNSPNNR